MILPFPRQLQMLELMLQSEDFSNLSNIEYKT